MNTELGVSVLARNSTTYEDEIKGFLQAQDQPRPARAYIDTFQKNKNKQNVKKKSKKLSTNDRDR